MPDAVIVDAVRTPIGRAVKGSLKSVRADDLAAVPLKALLDRNPQLESSSIVDVMMGCGFAEGESGYNIGRNAALLAGIDHHVAGTTVNRFCASSLQTTRMAFHAIKAGEGDTYIASGVEAVSRATQGGAFEFHPKLDGSEGSLYNVYIPMGLTAENVAEKCGVSREAQDEWAAISQSRAVAAQESGHFDVEIVSVTAPAHKDRDREGNEIEIPEQVVRKDDGPRPGTTVEKLAQLKPAFKPDGTVTAGNACPLNDGAAALLVTSEERAKELGIAPKVKILASTVVAIRPEIMGLGPVPAIELLLEEHGHVDERHRRRRDQRGVRGADRALQRAPGHRRREAQPVRRGDRPRAPLRDDRRAHHDDADQRPADARRHLRHRVDVRRRRHGHGDAGGADQLRRFGSGLVRCPLRAAHAGWLVLGLAARRAARRGRLWRDGARWTTCRVPEAARSEARRGSPPSRAGRCGRADGPRGA